MIKELQGFFFPISQEREQLPRTSVDDLFYNSVVNPTLQAPFVCELLAAGRNQDCYDLLEKLCERRKGVDFFLDSLIDASRLALRESVSETEVQEFMERSVTMLSKANGKLGVSHEFDDTKKEQINSVVQSLMTAAR